MSDSRFDFAVNPRFKQMENNKKKVSIDQRFSKMFSDDKFIEKCDIDKTGKKKKANKDNNRIKEFYRLDEDVDKMVTKELEKIKEEEEKKDEDTDTETETEWDSSDEEKEIDDAIWEDNLSQVETKEEMTGNKLAFMSCDWDGICAEDIYAICQSFAPYKEAILKTEIYLSDIGKEMLQKEVISGPIIIKHDNETKDNEEIRKYNINRAQYYFGVCYIDNKINCDKLYQSLDGSSVNSICDGRPLDVRVIPDEINFNTHKKESECKKLSKSYEATYEGRGLSGFSHTNAKCNWDSGNVKRKKDLMKKFTAKEMEEDDLKAYLASSDSESEDEIEIQKRRNLLMDNLLSDDEEFNNNNEDNNESDDNEVAKLIQKKRQTNRENKNCGVEGDMQMSFNTDAEALATKIIEKEKNPVKVDNEKKSAWQTYLDKKKEKKKERKQERREKIKENKKEDIKQEDDAMSKLLEDEKNGKIDNSLSLLCNDTKDNKGFDIKMHGTGKKRRQKELQEGDSFKLDVNDPRLSKLYNDPDFAIDPTATQFSNTKAMNTVLKEKRKRANTKRRKIEVNNEEKKIVEEKKLVNDTKEEDVSGISLFKKKKKTKQ